MRTKICARVVFGIAGSLLLCTAAAWAQTATSGTIAGSVTDATGAALPGVTVEARSPALIEQVRAVTSDGRGRYSIVDLRPGRYTVTFALTGFSTSQREGLEVTAGFTATVNAQLQVGAVAETIVVTGASPVVDVQSTRTQKVLAQSLIDALPAANTFNTYVALLPGVGNTSSLSRRDVGGTAGEPPFGLGIHGSDAGLTMIDGIATPSLQAATIHKVNPNPLAIQETIIETGNGSAEAWSGGVGVFVISKDGGNSFHGTVAASYAGEGWDSNNLTDALRARGLTQANKLKDVFDVGAGVGGPLKQDRLWFYVTPRTSEAHNYVAGVYYNKLPNTRFYEPDLSRQALFGNETWDVSGRVTWQVASTHKIVVQNNKLSRCFCPFGTDSGTRDPAAALELDYGPQNLLAVTWSHPASSRLLFEVAGAWRQDDGQIRLNAEALPTDRSYQDLALNLMYGSQWSPPGLGASLYGTKLGRHWVSRGSVSYVTGSHNFKTGWTTMWMNQIEEGRNNFDEQYVFRNRVPVSINQSSTPQYIEVGTNLVGLFVQDQWAFRRLTLNLGLRFDSIVGHFPAQTRPASTYLDALPLAAADDIPNWKNIHPRLGAAYDLFGNGRTALKVSLGRYELSNNFGVSLTRLASPLQGLVLSTSRTWTDANGNYVPDCDLYSKATSGECGPMANQNFGSRVISSRYADDLLQGWNVSPNLWQSQVSVQHQLVPNVGLTVGYFRTWYRNIYETDNLALTPADFDPYCVTVPVNPRLPGGGGNRLCDGLYDVTRAKFGQSDNVVTLAPDRSQVFNGIDVLFNARVGAGYQMGGGLSTGQTVTDNCMQRLPAGQFCQQTRPWASQTEFKVHLVAPLPWWGLQASTAYQSLPGIPQPATAVFSNAEIAPSLGRNLSSCPQPTGSCNATVIATIVEPNTLFEKRENQVDVRLSKIFRFGRARLQGNVDLFNVFNIATVQTMQTRYGPMWLNAQNILAARFVKIGAQFDF